MVVGAVLALLLYVGAWALGGLLEPGYDPTRQAISELFDLGASPATRLLLSVALLVSGVALVAFAVVLHRRLPGSSPLGPVAVAASGIATGAIVALPCTAGCPGIGATWLDTGHAIVATVGYGLLVVAPLLVGWRIRSTLPRLARWSWLLGGAAVAVFLVDRTGVLGWGSGLSQRVFNTTADLWYVVAALWLLQGRHLPPARLNRRRPPGLLPPRGSRR